MAISVVQPFDFNLLELLNATAQSLATAPAHKAGRFYFDSTLGKLGVSNGTAWFYLGDQTPFDSEAVQDAVAAMFAGSTGVTLTYNDGGNSATLTVGAGTITNAMVNAAAAISADKLADGTTNKVLTATERTKLTAIAAGATANSSDATLLSRANHTGTQTADTITAGSTNGVLTLVEKAKLAAIAAGATANQTDAYLLARANGTGTQSADTITDGTTNKVLTAALAAKLAGIAAGATVNSPDATLLSRANHTGTQLAATISDLSATISAQLALLVDSAPTALDTLNELAAALGDDPNFAASMNTALGLKANLSQISAVGLSGQYSALLGKPNYSTTIGDGTATTFVVTHNLNSRATTVKVAQAATPFATVVPEVQDTTVNTTTILFAVAPTVGQYTVTIQA